MASVQSTRKRRYESLAFGDEPTPHIESEGDRLIKDLSRKQLDTTLSLEKQKQNEKHFARGSGFVSLSAYNAGPSSADEIVLKTVWAQKFEQLRHYGLTNEEAAAILNGDDVTALNSKAELSVRLKRTEEVREILEIIIRKEDPDEGQPISRHEKELALAVKPTSDQTRLFAFALSCRQSAAVDGRLKDDRPLQHPINQLSELHDQLFADNNPRQAASTVLRKRRQMIESMMPPQQVPFEPVDETQSKKSNWDKQTLVETKPRTKSANREYTCKRETFYTIKDGKIVELKGKPISEGGGRKEEEEEEEEGEKKIVMNGAPFVVPLCEEEGVNEERKEEEGRERMTVDDIRSIPRFKDYNQGEPSKVLYLKNLSRNIDEEDLLELFSKYQKDNETRIVYRLMTGRMSGQAFVTFSSIEQATLALDEVFGVVVKGKPVVIQFGRNT